MFRRTTGEYQRMVEVCEAMTLGAIIGASGALLIELLKGPARPGLPPAA